uniref:Uncharacterized protein n=1 Tax=Arundo donax TaxID=35708 RepID=A0A0A9C112_ARUDO
MQENIWFHISLEPASCHVVRDHLAPCDSAVPPSDHPSNSKSVQLVPSCF